MLAGPPPSATEGITCVPAGRSSPRSRLPALAFAGCGGGNSDEDQIRGIINDVADNPAAVCDHMGSDLEKQLEQAGGCDKLAEESGEEGGGKVEITQVDVDGESATADITTDDGDETVEFAKEDGDWTIVLTD